MSNKWFLTAALRILILAAGLRFYRLDAQSFWNDEGNSARLSERSIPLIIEGTASDIHPPLYYLMLRGWRELVGETEFGLRSLSAFLGVGVVALTMALVNILDQKSRTLALLAAFLTAVNPALVYYSQEARMYELLAFLATGATVLLLRWLRAGAALKSKTAVAYTLTLAAGLYTHYFFPAVLASHMIILTAQFSLVKQIANLFPELPNRATVFLRGDGSPSHVVSESLTAKGTKATKNVKPYQIGNWLLLAATAVVLYLPWLPIFIRQAGGRPGMRLPIAEFVSAAGRWLAFGATIQPAAASWSLAALGLLLLIGLLPRQRHRFLYQFVALTGLAVPVLLMWLAGTTTPPFYKFMVVAVPPLALLAALGFGRAWRWGFASRVHLPALVGVLLLGLLLWGEGRSLQNLYFDSAYARADYRAIAAQIAAENHPKSAVILNAANQWEVFTYYYQDVDRVYPLPRGFPDPAQIEAELTALTEQYGRLYAIFWGEAERDPERLVERWLDANTFKAREEWVGDVRFVTYAVPDEPPEEMETAVNLQFGGAIRLLGYTVEPDVVRPGDILQVALFWERVVALETRYKVFLHLIGPDGKLWSQRDSEPGGGLALTTTWVAGQRVQDNHGLLVPVDAPPGQYALLLGLYDIADPNGRLPIEITTGTSDSFSIPIIVTK
jgi:hypothetical protein